MNLFLDLLCAFLNIDRLMPFAFGEKNRKALEGGKKRSQRLFLGRASSRVAGEICQAASQKHPGEPVFLPC